MSEREATTYMLSHLNSRLSVHLRIGILIGLALLVTSGVFLVMQRILLQVNDNIPTVSYCDLVDNHERYDQKIVRIRAIHVVGFEWSYLMDNDCTEETWVDMMSPDDPSCSVDLPKQLVPIDDLGGRRTVTVIGRFHGKSEFGYGHMMSYPYEFDVICIEDAGQIIPWTQPIE